MIHSICTFFNAFCNYRKLKCVMYSLYSAINVFSLFHPVTLWTNERRFSKHELVRTHDSGCVFFFFSSVYMCVCVCVYRHRIASTPKRSTTEGIQRRQRSDSNGYVWWLCGSPPTSFHPSAPSGSDVHHQHQHYHRRHRCSLVVGRRPRGQRTTWIV